MAEETPQAEILTEVESDGLVVGLYHYLWLKNGKGSACPDVCIPQTVVFQDGRPRVWFFTSSKEKTIMRKHKNNITNTNIVEAMTSGEEPGLGVCASFQGSMNLPSGKPKSATKRKKSGHLELQEEVIDWLDASALRELLPPGQAMTLGGPSMYEGVLQKFVMPRGEFNFSVKATWSPSACVLERRVNKAKLVDPLGTSRVPLQQRLVTWEGPTWLSEHKQLQGGVLSGKLSVLCDNIAGHLKEVTQGRAVVARMELHFKVDAASRVWLTHATSLKLDAQFLPRPVRSKVLRSTTSIKLTKLPPAQQLAQEELLGMRGQGSETSQAPSEMFTDAGDDGPLASRSPSKVRIGSRSVKVGGPALGTDNSSGAVGGIVGEDQEPRTLRSFHPNMAGAGGLNAALLNSAEHQQVSSPPGAKAAAAAAAAEAARAAASSHNPGNGAVSSDGEAMFLDVMSGEMCPESRRCEVTYKQLLQHWFACASQLPSESERLVAMDVIPPAIRRAYPALSREWYLRVRSQPAFLYKTAAVSAESARKLASAALEELNKGMTGPSRRGTNHGSAPSSPAAFSMGAGGRGASHSPGVRAVSARDRVTGPTARVSTALQPKQRPTTSPGMRTTGGSPFVQIHSGGGGGGGHGASSSRQTMTTPPPGPGTGARGGAGGYAGVVQANTNNTSASGGGGGSGTGMLVRQNSGLSDVSNTGTSPAASRRASNTNSIFGPSMSTYGGGGGGVGGQQAPLPSMLMPRSSPAQRSAGAGPGHGVGSSGGGGIMSAYAPSTIQQQHFSHMPPPPSAVGSAGASVRGGSTGQSPYAPGGATSPGAGAGAGGSSGSARLSPPRSPGAGAPSTLHTIHEEGAHAGALAAYHVDAGRPGSRPPTRGSTGSPGRGGIPGAVAQRLLSDSGELAGAAGSANSTLNSTGGSVASRRSARSALTNDDMATLKDLSDAYAQAEKLTQQLLAQAQDLLTDAVDSSVQAQQRVSSRPNSRPNSRGNAGGAGLGGGAGAGTSSSGSGRPSSRGRAGAGAAPAPSPLGGQQQQPAGKGAAAASAGGAYHASSYYAGGGSSAAVTGAAGYVDLPGPSYFAGGAAGHAGRPVGAGAGAELMMTSAEQDLLKEALALQG